MFPKISRFPPQYREKFQDITNIFLPCFYKYHDNHFLTDLNTVAPR